MNDECIFEIVRDNYKYKGVLFAELDVNAVDKLVGTPWQTSIEWIAGVMAIIWEDEAGLWHVKVRMKFPSGRKVVVYRDFRKEKEEGFSINETYVLQEIYVMPMNNKKWFPNPSQTRDGMFDIILESGMIEDIQTVIKDQ